MAAACTSGVRFSNNVVTATQAERTAHRSSCAASYGVSAPAGLGVSLPYRGRRTRATMATAANGTPIGSVRRRVIPGGKNGRRGGVARAAAESLIEPDLEEEPRSKWDTLGKGKSDLFDYGNWDGHHSWHEGDDGTFFEGIKEAMIEAGGPSGFQAVLAWGYPLALVTMMALRVEMMYALLMTSIFVVIFIAFEIRKPLRPFNKVKTWE